MNRAEKIAQSHALRAKGLLLREIAERLDISVSTAYTYANRNVPPFAAQECIGCGSELPESWHGRGRKWCSETCRKNTLYSRPCVDCGKRVSAYGRTKRCSKCQHAKERSEAVWTCAAIVAAIQAWANRHDGVPPTATDWNPAHAISLGHPEKAEKFYEGAWPASSMVLRKFGSWNTAIGTAGFLPRRPGCSDLDADWTLCQEIDRRYAAGESTSALAHAYGCNTSTIVARVRRAGGSVRTLSEANRLRWAAARVIATDDVEQAA